MKPQVAWRFCEDEKHLLDPAWIVLGESRLRGDATDEKALIVAAQVQA
jgi:hypothetical protein